MCASRWILLRSISRSRCHFRLLPHRTAWISIWKVFLGAVFRVGCVALLVCLDVKLTNTHSPLVGPIVGGFLIMSALSWRATFWFCVAFAGVIAVALLIFFPETFRDEFKWNDDRTVITPYDELNQPAAQDLSKEEATVNQSEITIEEKPRKGRQHPLAAFILLKHPYILIASLVSGIAFGCMFAVETIIPDLYEEYYGFNSWQTGEEKKSKMYMSPH